MNKALRVLAFASGRLYCTVVPRPYRRAFLFLPRYLGPVGLLLSIAAGAMAPVIDRALRRF